MASTMNKDITEIHRRMTLGHVAEAQLVHREAIAIGLEVALELQVAVIET
jgi:hypothetical protein